MSENNELKDFLLKEILEIKEEISPKLVKRLRLDLTEKIISRLSSFSGECTECKDYMSKLETNIINLRKNNYNQKHNSSKEYHKDLRTITEHLRKEHKLVPEGYYTETYMAVGIALGLPFGVVFSQTLDNPGFIGIGLPIGLSIGLSIGAGLDAKAKKDGLVI